MLMRLWVKANSYMLLVGKQITTATMEINTVIPPPKCPKSNMTVWCSYSSLWYPPREYKPACCPDNLLIRVYHDIVHRFGMNRVPKGIEIEV